MAGLNIGYDPNQVQGFVNIIWYIVIGLIFALIIGYLLWNMYRRMTYNLHITIHEKLGNAILDYEEWAREVNYEDQYYFHYKGINKLSEQWDPKFQVITKKKGLFGIPKSYKGYHVYKDGKKMIPMMVGQAEIKPFDMDLFNFMQARIKTNIQKYQKQNIWLQMAPIIGVGLVVMMFIIGMIFYTKHVETVANMILNAAQNKATEILQYAGVQNIPPAGG